MLTTSSWLVVRWFWHFDNKCSSQNIRKNNEKNTVKHLATQLYYYYKHKLKHRKTYFGIQPGDSIKINCHCVNTPNGFTAATMKAKRVHLLPLYLSIYLTIATSFYFSLALTHFSICRSLSDPFLFLNITLGYQLFFEFFWGKRVFYTPCCCCFLFVCLLFVCLFCLFVVNIHFHILYIYNLYIV